MHKYLKRLVDERNSLAGLTQTVADKAAAEDRELTDAEQERLRDWQTRGADLDRQITEQTEYLETQRSWARLQDRLTDVAGVEESGTGTVAVATRGATPAKRTNWGEAFVNSPGFKDYRGYGSMVPVEVGEVFDTRAAIDTGLFDVPPHVFSPALWTMTTPFLDVIGHERVSTGTVEWIKWPGSYPLAAIVPEGQLKPEADIAPTTETQSLETVAHWKGITRQALEDLPRIQSIVENALRQGIVRKLEELAATALTGDADVQNVTNADLLAGIRIALGEVQDAGYSRANAVLLNPADFAALDISVMGSTTAGPVTQSGFWGLRAIAVGALPAGTAYVGDFQTGVTMFERNTASVYMTDSHADYFIRNTLVILAETRALPVVTAPDAIREVTTTAPAP